MDGVKLTHTDSLRPLCVRHVYMALDADTVSLDVDEMAEVSLMYWNLRVHNLTSQMHPRGTSLGSSALSLTHDV